MDRRRGSWDLGGAISPGGAPAVAPRRRQCLGRRPLVDDLAGRRALCAVQGKQLAQAAVDLGHGPGQGLDGLGQAGAGAGVAERAG
jgi:hypothetical protein